MRNINFATLLLAVSLSSSLQISAQSLPPITENHLHLRSQAAADTLQEIDLISGNDHSVSVPEAITAEQALLALDRAGIQRALAISNAYIFSMPELNPSGEYLLVQAENNYVAQQVSLSNGRLTGLCSVNPLSDYALDEVQRCAQQLGLAGVKLHFANSNIRLRRSAHISKLASFFEFLEVLEYPALIHLRTRSRNYGAVDVRLFIDHVLTLAPTIDLQIAHFAGGGGYDLATDRAIGEFISAFESGRLEPSRVQFDIAAVTTSARSTVQQSNTRSTGASNAMLAGRIRQLDPQQLLFGTDWPSWPKNVPEQERIAESISILRNSLQLTQDEIEQLFQTQSRLLNSATPTVLLLAEPGH